ncbi:MULTISPECIES: hypothetical protein [unclassified Streptomyces]|nr:hypothetical protein [Streptomyces sp. CB02980]
MSTRPAPLTTRAAPHDPLTLVQTADACRAMTDREVLKTPIRP